MLNTIFTCLIFPLRNSHLCPAMSFFVCRFQVGEIFLSQKYSASSQTPIILKCHLSLRPFFQPMPLPIRRTSAILALKRQRGMLRQRASNNLGRDSRGSQVRTGQKPGSLNPKFNLLTIWSSQTPSRLSWGLHFL